MSADSLPRVDAAAQTERGVFLGEARFLKTLTSFIRHSYAHPDLEANNYTSISYLLSVHGMACHHPDPDVVVGVTPQSPFEATFGTSIRRRSPDWSKTLIVDQETASDSPHYRPPRLGALWEDKQVDGELKKLNAASRRSVVAQAMTSVSSDLKQLREQALCAFLKFPDDKFYAFLSYRDCWFLFEFHRPNNLGFLRTKYKGLFEAAAKVKQSQTSSATAPTFEEDDLPIPDVDFAGELLLSLDNTKLSKPLLIALSRVRARLGLSVDQSSPFWISPDAAEDVSPKNEFMIQVEAIIGNLKPQKPVGPSTATGNPQQGSGESQQGAAESQQGAVEPERGVVEPQQGAVEPQQGAVEPQQGAVEPQQGEQGAVEPQQGTTEPQEGTAEPEETSSASESESESTMTTSQDSHSSDESYVESGSPLLSSSTGSNDSTAPDSLLGDLSLDALSNEAATSDSRAQDYRQETADCVLDELAQDPDAPSDDETEIQVATVSPPRRGLANGPRSITTGEGPLIAEPASDETGIPKATVRRSARSRKNMPANSGPAPTEKPSQIDTHRGNHRARSRRGAGSSNVEDRVTDQAPAGPLDEALDDVSEASNAAIGTDNPEAAGSQRRVQPQVVPALNRQEDNDNNFDVRDRTGTTGLLRKDTEVIGDPEAGDGRPRVRSSARLAAQSKDRRDNPAARSVAQTGKKRKVPAGGNARVTAATGRSTLAGPSNAQTPAARGRTKAPRGCGANRKKKDHDA